LHGNYLDVGFNSSEDMEEERKGELAVPVYSRRNPQTSEVVKAQ